MSTESYRIALDSETGGLNPAKVDILTLYLAVVDEDFKIVDELDLKLKPNDRLPIVESQALKVNGINIQEHLADPTTITYAEAGEKIQTMLRKHLKKRGRYSNLRPLGQNLPFDLSFIWQHVVDKDSWDKIVHYAIIDTKQITDFFKDCGFFPRDLSGLGSVIDYLGIPKRDAHNAKGDTLMTLDLYKKLIEIMKSKKDVGGQQVDLISLLESE